MSLPIIQLVPTQIITNAAVTYYTNPYAAGTNGLTKIFGFIFANTDSVARAITMHNVPAGGAAANGNKIFAAVEIPPNTSWVATYPDGFLIIPAGGFLQFLASVTNVITITINGAELA